MDDVVLVQVPDSFEDRPHNRGDLGVREPLIQLPLLHHEVPEGASRDKFHQQVDAGGRFFELIELHDVRVLNGGQDLRLFPEVVQFRFREVLLQEHLKYQQSYFDCVGLPLVPLRTVIDGCIGASAQGMVHFQSQL